MADETRRLIEIFRERSVRTGRIVLSSGKISDFYVDGKQTALHAEGGWLIGRLILERLHPEVTGVGGLLVGAAPIATAVSVAAWSRGREVHAFMIRKEPKGHGTGQYVEGMRNLPEGSKVCIVEDATTTGGSLIRAVERARAAGLNVVQTITLVDREEGAAENLAAAGYVLEALVTRSDLQG